MLDGELPTAAALREAAVYRSLRPVWVTWSFTRQVPRERPTGRGLRGRAARGLLDWWSGPWDAVGILDPAGRRFALDMGAYATSTSTGRVARARRSGHRPALPRRRTRRHAPRRRPGGSRGERGPSGR